MDFKIVEYGIYIYNIIITFPKTFKAEKCAFFRVKIPFISYQPNIATLFNSVCFEAVLLVFPINSRQGERLGILFENNNLFCFALQLINSCAWDLHFVNDSCFMFLLKSEKIFTLFILLE